MAAHAPMNTCPRMPHCVQDLNHNLSEQSWSLLMTQKCMGHARVLQSYLLAWPHKFIHMAGPLQNLPLPLLISPFFLNGITMTFILIQPHLHLTQPRFIESHWFVWATQMSHLPMEVDYDQQHDWVTSQLKATCNVESSFFNDWWSGHLNFQIEHQ